MPKLPQVSAREMLRVLYELNFRIVTQKGSHIKLIRLVGGLKERVIIPNHKLIRKGTLRNILRKLNLLVDDFIKLLK